MDPITTGLLTASTALGAYSAASSAKSARNQASSTSEQAAYEAEYIMRKNSADSEIMQREAGRSAASDKVQTAFNGISVTSASSLEHLRQNIYDIDLKRQLSAHDAEVKALTGSLSGAQSSHSLMRQAADSQMRSVSGLMRAGAYLSK